MQHTEQQTEQAPSPAEVRVRPEELAKALAAIEARREQSSREAAETIPIGEAVQQFGFDVTPAEVWAEVQAGRVREAGRGTRHRRKHLRWAAGLGAALLALGGLGYARTHSYSDPSEQASPAAAPPVKQPNVTNQNIRVTAHTPNGPLVELLSEVPDGHPMRSTYDDASKITPGYLGRSSGRPTIPGYVDAPWTLIKYGGKVYLRGWSKSRVSPGALAADGMTVYSDRAAAGANAVPVTLRIGGFDSDVSQGSYGGDSGWEAITVTDVHSDAHLWEKE